MPKKNFFISTVFTAKDKVSKVVGKMHKNLGKFTAKASMSLRKMDRAASRVAKTFTGFAKKAAFGAAAGVTALAGAVGLLMKQFSKVEDYEAAFTPLMKGAAGAKRLVAALNETAATTPFQLENLADSAQLFLPSVNGNIEETIRLTRMMGDASGGNAQKFKSASLAMAKIMMTGKTTAEGLTSFVIAGIPIYKELAEVLNVPAESIATLSRQGKLSSDIMLKVFEKMTSKGGIFFKGMDIASRTLTGKISTLKDNISLTAAEIGSTLAPTLKEATDYLIKVAAEARSWAVANKELIKTKVTEFIKKIPGYFKETVYWLRKLEKYGKFFITFVVIIKSARVAMALFSAVTMAATTNVGKLQKSGKKFGKTMPEDVGKGTKAIGKFQASLFALQAFMVGWEIGTVIHDKIVEPLMKARHEAKMLRLEMEDTMKRDVDKRGTEQLRKDKVVAEKVIKADKSAIAKLKAASAARGFAPTGSIVGGGGKIGAKERYLSKVSSTLEARFQKHQEANVSKFSVSAPAAVGPGRTDTLETFSNQSSEVVVKIQDDTGRAKIVKGKSVRNVELVHSGAPL